MNCEGQSRIFSMQSKGDFISLGPNSIGEFSKGVKIDMKFTVDHALSLRPLGPFLQFSSYVLSFDVYTIMKRYCDFSSIQNHRIFMDISVSSFTLN